MKIHIGCNCYVDSKWIPKRIPTGLYDINGVEIKTSDTITLTGCSSKTAIIGKTPEKIWIYFGSINGSIGWWLDERTIKNHNIKVINSN